MQFNQTFDTQRPERAFLTTVAVSPSCLTSAAAQGQLCGTGSEFWKGHVAENLDSCRHVITAYFLPSADKARQVILQ